MDINYWNSVIFHFYPRLNNIYAQTVPNRAAMEKLLQATPTVGRRAGYFIAFWYAYLHKSKTLSLYTKSNEYFAKVFFDWFKSSHTEPGIKVNVEGLGEITLYYTEYRIIIENIFKY